MAETMNEEEWREMQRLAEKHTGADYTSPQFWQVAKQGNMLLGEKSAEVLATHWATALGSKISPRPTRISEDPAGLAAASQSVGLKEPSAKRYPLKRFVCNLNQVLESFGSGSKALSVLCDSLDRASAQSSLTKQAQEQEQLKASHCYIRRDYEADTTQIINENAEYTADELAQFAQIQRNIKELCTKYGAEEEAVEQLFVESACDWSRVEERLRAPQQQTWSADEDRLIKQLFAAKGSVDILSRAAALGLLPAKS